MTMRRAVGAAALLVLTSSCAATMPTGDYGYLPDDANTACYDVCGHLGFQLGAVVVIRNSVGCVCQPPATGATASTGGGTAAAAGAIIVAEEEAARQASAAAATSYGR